MLYILIQGQSASLMNQLPMFAVLLGIIYFFFIRPSAKKQKDQDTFLTSLEKGKEIVTSSGLIGKITKMDDKEITLQVSEKTFVRMTKGSISNELTKAFFKVEEKKK